LLRFALYGSYLFGPPPVVVQVVSDRGPEHFSVIPFLNPFDTRWERARPSSTSVPSHGKTLSLFVVFAHSSGLAPSAYRVFCRREVAWPSEKERGVVGELTDFDPLLTDLDPSEVFFLTYGFAQHFGYKREKERAEGAPLSYS
jgi:hypothetical protein